VGRLIIAGIVLVVGAFVGTTWWALEWSGVALIGTQQPDGEIRTTRIWHATYQGEVWLEAGSAESPWFEDLENSRAVILTIDGKSHPYRAEPVPNPEGHEKIRKLLRQKYGLRDRWVGLILDVSPTLAVRLVPTSGP
jgi:hypothetical protein